MHIDTSYSKTLEKTPLPYITNNIQHISTQHGFKCNHSTSTSLHNINKTIATGFNQKNTRMQNHSSTRHEQSIRHSKRTHTHNKLHQTNISHTILKLITNYFKCRKAYTTFRNKTSTQRQFKTGVPQGGVLSPTLLTYTHLTLQNHRQR